MQRPARAVAIQFRSAQRPTNVLPPFSAAIGRAGRVREQFLAESAGVTARAFPLVQIDLRNRDAPFSDG